MAQCQGPRVQIARLFLSFTHVWQKDVAKISKMPGAPHNVNPPQAITRLVGNNHLFSCGDSGVLCVIVTSPILVSHALASVVANLIAHTNLALLRMACLRSAEPVREFFSAVTSTEAAAGIYTLIRNSVQIYIYIDCYTDQCRSQCACFAFARRACWPCQQDSCNKNNEKH